MKGEKTKVRIIYHHKIGCIVYQKGDMVVGAILSNYDDVVRVIDFKNGLLTVLMKKNNKHVEEYVDFHQSLAVIYMAKLASKYFDGVTADDIELERA